MLGTSGMPGFGAPVHRSVILAGYREEVPVPGSDEAMSTTRRVASTAAYSAGAVTGAAALAWGLLHAQVAFARHVIGKGMGRGYDDEGTYGAGFGDPHRILVLGDSTATGVGADSREQTVGATVATGVAALTGRPVELRNLANSGATSPQLLAQVDRGLAAMSDPEVALVLIGANDVAHRLDQAAAVRALARAVTRLREAGAEVVVATCPDLGSIRPVPQPLRSLGERWSRDLAAKQTVAVVEAGGRTVSLGDLLGPQFRELPAVMFSADRYHPSAAGYARVAAAILPSVCDALGMTTADTGREPDRRRGEHVEPLPDAARRAAHDPGSEVTGTEVRRGPAGELRRWARLLRRHRAPVPEDQPV